jgi:hypothetical protein
VGLISLLQVVNALFPKVPVHSKEEERRKEAEIVSLYANGELSLCQGKYLTTEDIKQRRDNLAKYKF